MELNYTQTLSAATLYLAQGLTRLEKDTDRKRKKENFIADKCDKVRRSFFKDRSDLALEEDVRGLIEGDWSRDQAMTLIIDLAFTNPFAPYELNFEREDFWRVLKEIGVIVRLYFSDVERVCETQQEAFQAHGRRGLRRAALVGSIGGIVLLGTGGWLLAPLIGTAVGTAAGLSGAAATSHGLAILGGGSLAIGGMGMAGGMWVVTGAGAALGLLGSKAALGLLEIDGVPLLLEIETNRFKIELVKLQVYYKEVLLADRKHLAESRDVIASLTQLQDKIMQQLERERELNEKNAQRVKDIEAKLEVLENALKWMKKAGGNGGSTEDE